MSSLIPADEALAILRAAGVNAAKSPARGRCRTLCYLVGGQCVNLGRLRELARDAQAAQAEPAPVVAEPRRPVLPGEPEPVAARVAEPGPVTLPGEGRAAVAATLPTRFAGGGFAGFAPWDPGTPEARARVALQGERVATLWPIAQAVRGAGFDLPPAWWPDGPVMAGEHTYGEALAALPLGAIAAAAAALAALPPVTAAQDRALRLCRGEAVGV